MVRIVAEIGINHCGNLSKALSMIESAAASGADSVKFQTFSADKFYSRYSSSYLNNTPLSSNYDLIEFFRKFEFTEDDYIKLKKAADECGVDFFSSPFDPDSIEMLERIGVKRYKIASGSLNDVFLIEKILSTGKEIIASTGLHEISEIEKSVQLMKKKNAHLILLHCVSLYPLADSDVNLKRMISLKDRFGLDVGFSDHSPDALSSLCAVSLGACVIEKHFKTEETDPDACVSLNPSGFKDMVDSIRRIENITGSGSFAVTSGEKNIARSANMSFCSLTRINKGEKITRDLLCAKRPGTGISPLDMELVLGKTALEDIEEDCLIDPKYIG
ncbi:MAG TPA: N-acetylneuraminate synthase family protein [Spirochaetota bacterium]|nr:N-acetylneuraminate synthase family protein [Spirochaetota bacterium]